MLAIKGALDLIELRTTSLDCRRFFKNYKMKNTWTEIHHVHHRVCMTTDTHVCRINH